MAAVKDAQKHADTELGDEFWDNHAGGTSLQAVIAAVRSHAALAESRRKVRDVVDFGLAKLDASLGELFETFPCDNFATIEWSHVVCKGDWGGRTGLLDPGCDMTGTVLTKGFEEGLNQAVETVTGMDDDVLIEQ
eukprot:7572873-Pyramimonas_sp.AAC.1